MKEEWRSVKGYKYYEIRQRLGRINRYANKFKYWNESEDTNK